MTPVVFIAGVAALGWIFGFAVGAIVVRSWERRRRIGPVVLYPRRDDP